MSKRKKMVALSTGAGVFVDEETNFKVLPKQTVELDEATAGARTLNALKFGHLVESGGAAGDADADTTADDDAADKTQSKTKK